MAQRSCDDVGVERALLIDGALDDLWWIYSDVKMVTTSLTWHHRSMIKDLEQAYRAKEEVDWVEFEPVKADKQACSYDVDHFVIFYGNILE